MGRPVTQFQILSRNPERSAEFYTALFDWTVDADNPLGYRTISTGSDRGIQGGIWPAGPEGHGMVQLFVEVDDVTASTDAATALGGSVIMPPQHLPAGEMLAILLDTDGTPFGVFRPAPATHR